MLEETNRAGREQEERRKTLAPLERKHVDEVLDYLYRNPDARHGKMADEIGVSASYLSELLNLLLKTGYICRYGEHKNTRYRLTKTGRQARKAKAGKWEKREELREELIDIEFKEIMEKDNFMKERFRETERHIESEEEEYAKWNRYFGAAAETTAN